MSYHFLFLAGIFLGPVSAYDGCSKYVLVNVSDGSYTRNGLFEKDGIAYTPNNLVIDDGYMHGCICNIFTCFRKCCPKGYTMINESCQLLESVLRFNVYNDKKYLDVSDNTNFYVVYNNRCATDMFFRLTPKSEVTDAFYVQQDGRLYVPYYTFSSNVYYPDEYCLEMFIDEDGSQELGALVCNVKEQLHTYGDASGTMNYYLITGITVHLVFSTRSEALVPNQTWYPLKTLFYTYTDEFQCANGSICVRKCCAQNYVITENNCTEKTGSSINVSVYDGTQKVDGHSVDYVVGMLYCEYGYYKLEPNVYPDDLYLVQENGSLWKTATKEFFSPHEYCLDSLADDTSVFLCISEKHVHLLIALRINVVGMIISMPFLLITFLVYAVLPDRNLHGKCLMCYVITLFCAYALLIFIQLYPIAIEVRACKTLGILCLFFFMVSFFWMNVMSIDICWTFSGMRGFSGSRKEAERKRFLVYCGYAWGMPFLLAMMVTGLSISADSDMNAWYNPGMGDGQCWFRDGIPTMLYFYLPMALLIIINLTLFCTTACKIKRVQQDTAMLRKDESNKQSYESDKQRFNLYLKLLLAMGVNWSMEIISWIVDWQIGQVPPPVWYITDFCNALYGVFIFFIFVFKQNIWKLLKRRYYMVIGKPSLARSMTQSAYSPRTTGSSLNHTVSNDKSYVNDSSVLTSEVA